MKLQPECVACIIAQVNTVTTMLNLPESGREEAMRDTRAYLAHSNNEACTPESMGDLWKILLGHIDGRDPYAAIKSRCNQEARMMLPDTRRKMKAASNPFEVALKYAIAGNLIDYGMEHHVSIEEQNALIDTVASTAFSRDDSEALLSALSHAKTMLYLGDNAGEIVFDRLLIEQIQTSFPQIELSFVVKGSAVLNDVTYTDAEEAGLGEIVRVIDNGDGSPGTVLHRTSESFQRAFWDADVILSKGQGNYESLSGEKKENLFFLFTAKCETVCVAAGVPKRSIVCMRNIVL